MKKLLQELSFFQHFSDIGLFVLSDQDFHILYCNEYMEKNAGFHVGERPCYFCCSQTTPCGACPVRKLQEDPSLSECSSVQFHSQLHCAFDLTAHRTALSDGTPVYLGLAKPHMYLNEEKEALEERIEHDELTGALTRPAFCRHTSKLLKSHPETEYTIVRTDIYGLRMINDLFQSQAGDALLHDFYESVLKHLKPGDTCGRFYADSFCICTSMNRGEILDFMEQLQHDMDHYPLAFHISLYFGICPVYDRNMPPYQLADFAKMALQKARTSYSQPYSIFNEEFRQQVTREQTLIQSMEPSLKNGDFVPYFQPFFDIRTKSIVGAEVLVRWNHPIYGMISPASFIPVFEKNGFIIQLDQYIWEEAAKLLWRRKKEGRKRIPFSVNVSRAHIFDEDFEPFLLGLMEKYELDPGAFGLELTESVYVESQDTMAEAVARLQKKGFRFLMDDFGSGYSSLSVLKDCPMDVLKIDMTFVRDILESPRSQIILSEIIHMMHRLNLPMIAEGVENPEQTKLLKNWDCNTVQGYYFARPMPAEAFEKLIDETQR